MSPSADRPDLTQLRIQAKELVRGVRAADGNALARALVYFPTSSEFTLASAQLVIARENGFESWPKLRRALDMAPPVVKSKSALLFEALDSDDDETAVALLRANPELAGAWRKKQYGWECPLNVAAERGRIVSTKALVEAGATLYTVNQGGYPPVYNAVHEGHKEVSEYLLAESMRTDGGLPPTFGCGIDIVLATRLGMLDRVKMHVERDPMAVYRRGCIGESVLHWSAHNEHIEVVRFLLDSGALIEADEIGLYGGKPLHWGSEHAPKSVELLLERGADPNARNKMRNEFEGYTPLHMMARQREQCLECAQLLLDAGADPKLTDAKGHTALDVAIENGRDRVKEFLEPLTV